MFLWLLALFTTKSGVSGMGFTIMDSFSDKCTIKSRPGKGTIVTMEFGKQ